MDKHNEEHIYVAIDLKSFYASVECRERERMLWPLIWSWQIQPARRRLSVLQYRRLLRHMAYRAGRAFFEVVQRVKEVNKLRLSKLMASGHAAGQWREEKNM